MTIENISARAMHALNWAIAELGHNIATQFEVDTPERKTYAAKVKEARDAYNEIKDLRKAIAQGDVK